MVKNNKALVICNIDNHQSNGQTVRTEDTISFLSKHGFEIDVLNYGILNVFQKFFISKREIKEHEKIIIMPGGKKALKFYTKLVTKLKKTNTHYVTVGGWLVNLINDKKCSKTFSRLKLFKGIYLQNKTAVDLFKENGFKNVYFVSNYSTKKPITSESFESRLKALDSANEYKFCFFARVSEEKGVLLACDAINQINRKDVFLDIYGKFENENIKKQIEEIERINPNIKYKGIVTGDDSIKTLSTYYFMLFPTFYKGEGTPHSIIESYMAGLPIIASNWAFNGELVESNKTGLLFELGSNELTDCILRVIDNKDLVKELSINCYKKHNTYSPENLLKPLLDNLNN